jgi:acyl-CoA thioester hydrolase
MSREIETYRGFVYPWVIDHVGHMNVQSYTARFDETSWHFLAHLGLTPGYLKANNRGLVAIDQRTQYRLEVFAGSLLDIRTTLLETGNKDVAIRSHDAQQRVGRRRSHYGTAHCSHRYGG